MAEVSLAGVRKVYGTGADAQVAVHGIDLEVADGELVVLVGPSGCGKTTTLRMIAGLESITAGEIRIGEHVVNDVAPRDRDVAMVFQSYALYPHMTAYENMAFALELRRLPRAEVEARVQRAAATLGIEELLQRRPRQLSGGQRQRVALGRALVRQPQVFLFDEPLSNLDARLRVQMRREIARLHHQLAATMVYVTHDQVEAMTLGDRIVVLHAGRVQQVGKPLELYERPANTFVAAFIGSPPMNLVAGTLRRDHAPRFHAHGGGPVLAVPADWSRLLDDRGERAVLAGVRPEHLHVCAPHEPDSFPGRLELVEPMGNELHLSVRAGTQDLTARVPPQPLPPLGAEIVLHADAARLHAFDPHTTSRLA